jgi:hypothetical protein
VIYGSEEQAFRRVETLKQRGVWPGVRYRADGAFEVTYDPDVLGEPTPDLPSAPQSELGWERNQQHTQREPRASDRTHAYPAKSKPLVMERRLP